MASHAKMTDRAPRESLIQSKIPLPISKIPTYKPANMKNKRTNNLVSKAPGQRVNVITPIISKRFSPKNKKFVTSKGISKPVLRKRESEVVPKLRAKKCAKQATLPDNFLKYTSKKDVVPKVVISKSTPEKENDPPSCREGSEMLLGAKLLPEQSRSMSALQSQKCMNIHFEASEFSLNQILNERELSPSQLKSPFSKPGQPKKLSSRFSNFQLEEIKKLGLSRKTQSPAKACPFSKRESGYDIAKTVRALKKDMNFSSGESRRCTWAPGSPLRTSQPDPFEVAMASIKKLILTKAPSPLVKSTPISSSGDAQVNKPHDLCDDFKKRIAALGNERASGRESMMTPRLRQTTFAFRSPKISTPAKPTEFDGQKSMYRPLEKLCNSAMLDRKKRLTDISEHSENDTTRSLTSSFSEVIPSNLLPISEKSDATTTRSSLIFSHLDHFSGEKNSIYKSPFLPARPVSTKELPSTHLHTPRPLSFYSKKPTHDHFPASIGLTSVTFHSAPICTPLVMQTIARQNEEQALLSPVQMKLDFDNIDCANEKETIKEQPAEIGWDRRYSISTQHILTRAKLDEIRADEECWHTMAVQSAFFSSSSRMLCNPVAKILTEGDCMHIVPIAAAD